MNRKTLLTGVLGALAMFLWTFIAHMVLPLGEAGIRQISNEQPLLTAMQSTLNAPGFYMFPAMDPDRDEAKYQRKIETGPSGLLLYFPTRSFNFGSMLGCEFLTELFQALVAVYLLTWTRARTFGARLAFYALLGLLACIATNVSYWNWYGFPTTYTLAYMFTGWMGYLCAGLVAAAMKPGSSAPAAS